MLSKYKYIVESFFKKIFRESSFLGHISPNFLTFFGLVFSLSILVLLEIKTSFSLFMLNFWIIVLIILSGFMDAMDGYVARHYNKVSKFGGFLDSTLDRVSDAIYAYIFLKLGIINDIFFLCLLTGFFLVSYCRARAEGLGIRMKGIGIIERGERIVAIIAILFLNFFNMALSFYGLVLLLILTWITVFQRVYHVYISSREG